MIYSIHFVLEGKEAPSRDFISIHIFKYLLSAIPQLRFENCSNFPLLPTRTENCFSGWLTHFGNIKATGQEKIKKESRRPFPIPQSHPLPSPGELFFPFSLACCFWIWACSKHTPLFGLWAAWETKESLSSKLDQVIQLLRTTSKHSQVSHFLT